MKRALLALLVIGCKGTIIGEVIDPSSQLPNGTTPSSMPEPTMPTSSTARCEGVAMARSYHSLTGEALEASRVDSAVTLDTRRPRTWENITAYGDDLNQQFGYYLASNGALNFATVPVRPEYWRADAQLGALELYSHFRVGYIVCTRMLSEPNGSAAFTTSN